MKKRGNCMEFFVERNIRINKNFHIQLILADNKLWLRISGLSRIRYFSCNHNESEAMSVDELLKKLKTSLDSADSNQVLIDEALMIYPKGWERWGPGIPQTISSFAETKFFLKKISEIHEESI